MSSIKSSIKKLKIIYVAQLFEGSTGFGYLQGFQELGHTVQEIDTTKWLGNWSLSLKKRISLKISGGRLPKNTVIEMNQAIVKAADKLKPDLIFFVNAPYILPETLKHTHRYGLNFCHFQDDMFNPSCRTYTFFDCLPYWDCVFSARKINIEEYLALGVSHAVFVWQAYVPSMHHPVKPTTDEYENYKGDVAFIGGFHSPSRADLLAEIINKCPNVNFNIWGPGWNLKKRPQYWMKLRRWATWQSLLNVIHNYPLLNDEMSKAMNSNKIVLGLLNHENRDLHTSRTMEIPACGAFMLAERTSEHLELFEEGKEAEYFSSVEEAVSKINYYLVNDEERQKITQAGYKRLLGSEYSFFDRARSVMKLYDEIINEN